MTITTFNSRKFARDAAAVKRAAQNGPVIITHRGKPALAVLNIDDYYRMAGAQEGSSLLEAMHGLPQTEGIDLTPAARQKPDFDHRIPAFDDGVD